MPSAVLLDRVSTGAQARSGVGMESRLPEMESYCASRKWPIIGSFADPGITGRGSGVKKRKGLQSALALCREHNASLVVYTLSRLMRNAPEARRVLDELKAAGCDLVVVDMNLDTTTAVGKMMFTVMAAVAELFSDQQSETAKLIHAHFKQKYGCVVMGQQPYGWHWDSDLKARVKDPDAQDVLAYIHDARKGKERLSFLTIANELNELGRSSPRGGMWHPESVRRVYAAALKMWKRRTPTTPAASATYTPPA